MLAWMSFGNRLRSVEKMLRSFVRTHDVMVLDHEEMMARNFLLEKRVSFLEHMLNQTRHSHRMGDDSFDKVE